MPHDELKESMKSVKSWNDDDITKAAMRLLIDANDYKDKFDIAKQDKNGDSLLVDLRRDAAKKVAKDWFDLVDEDMKNPQLHLLTKVELQAKVLSEVSKPLGLEVSFPKVELLDDGSLKFGTNTGDWWHQNCYELTLGSNGEQRIGDVNYNYNAFGIGDHGAFIQIHQRDASGHRKMAEIGPRPNQ